MSAFFDHNHDIDHAIHQQADNSRATTHYPVTIRPHRLEALVFSGGGVSGILHYATLEGLQHTGVLASSSERGLLHNTHIRCVVGTSAGALTALLLCLGCNMSNLYDQMQHVFPVQERLDVSMYRILRAAQTADVSQLSLLNPVELHRILYQTVEYYLPKWSTFFQTTQWNEVCSVDVFPATPANHIPGLDCHCRSRQGCLTFSLFRYLTGMDLRTIVTDVVSCNAFECSAESTPDVCIFQATLASMSIPLLLPPIFLVSRQWNSRYRECRDGGFTCNYPMWFAMRTYPPSHVIGSCIGSSSSFSPRASDGTTSALPSSSYVVTMRTQPHETRQTPTMSTATMAWGSWLYQTPLMEGLTDMLAMRPHLSEVFHSTYKTLFALLRTQLQFSTWKFIPERWKHRTIFPPKRATSALHLLSVQATCSELTEEIRWSKQALLEMNAIHVKKRKEKYFGHET